MKQRLVFLLRYYIYWIFLFIFSKLLFVFYQYPLTKMVDSGAIFSAIRKGLVMDISIGGYILMLTSLILSFCVLLRGVQYGKYIRFLNLIFLCITFFIVVGDFELYRHWGFHVDSTPLFYLQTQLLLLTQDLQVIFQLSYLLTQHP